MSHPILFLLPWFPIPNSIICKETRHGEPRSCWSAVLINKVWLSNFPLTNASCFSNCSRTSLYLCLPSSTSSDATWAGSKSNKINKQTNHCQERACFCVFSILHPSWQSSLVIWGALVFNKLWVRKTWGGGVCELFFGMLWFIWFLFPGSCLLTISIRRVVIQTRLNK